METKRCSKCGKVKGLEELSFRNKKQGIRSSWCKLCRAKGAAKWRKENRDKVAEQQRRSKEAYWKNPKDFRKRQRDYTAKHRDHINQQRRDWSQQNRERVRASRRRYYERHKKKIIAKTIEEQRRYRETLHNSYVRRLIQMYMLTEGVKIPQPFIESKREEIRLKRLLREQANDRKD